MRLKQLGVAAVLTKALVLVGASTSVLADPSTDDCNQLVKGIIASGSTEGTYGDAVSDGFYGNEPNIIDPHKSGVGLKEANQEDPGSVAGRAVPSQSPGQKVTNPDGTVRDGASLGMSWFRG